MYKNNGQSSLEVMIDLYFGSWRLGINYLLWPVQLGINDRRPFYVIVLGQWACQAHHVSPSSSSDLPSLSLTLCSILSWWALVFRVCFSLICLLAIVNLLWSSLFVPQVQKITLEQQFSKSALKTFWVVGVPETFSGVLPYSSSPNHLVRDQILFIHINEYTPNSECRSKCKNPAPF